MWNLFNFFKKGVTVDVPMSGLQNVVVTLLQDLERNHLEIARFFTMGKLSDAKIEEYNQDILHICKMLHSVENVVHGLIPESMTHLHKFMDWSEEIYKEVIAPNIK